MADAHNRINPILKKNQAMVFDREQMEMGVIVLRKISPTQKTKGLMVTPTHGI